jgi:microcystin-dependent protein
MSTPFLGQLSLQGFAFAPKGYALCNGQLLPINQNQALFSLLGTQYGGNGTTTFALPDLRSRIPLGMGGLYTVGALGGTESVTIQTTQIPAHTHALSVSTLSTPLVGQLAGNTVGTQASTNPAYANTSNSTMSTASLSPAGSSQPHENRSPFTVLVWVIALTGIFPSRS